MKPFHELINQSLPGTMVQHLYSLGGEGWLAGLAVREDSATLARLPKRVDIHSRGALIQVEHVHLILLMLQIESGPSTRPSSLLNTRTAPSSSLV